MFVQVSRMKRDCLHRFALSLSHWGSRRNFGPVAAMWSCLFSLFIIHTEPHFNICFDRPPSIPVIHHCFICQSQRDFQFREKAKVLVAAGSIVQQGLLTHILWAFNFGSGFLEKIIAEMQNFLKQIGTRKIITSRLKQINITVVPLTHFWAELVIYDGYAALWRSR